MSLEVVNREQLLKRLLPHQRAILDKYSSQIRCVYLDAPTGAGKTMTAVALAVEEAHRNANARILVIAPVRNLVLQYADRLKAMGLRTTLIDRYVYRALIDGSQSAPTWPEGTAYGITTGLAIQTEVSSTLIDTQWDLLIADEQPGPDTAYGKVLTQILASSRKALIIGSFGGVQENAAPESAIVKWNLHEMVDQAGQSIAPPPPSFKTIEFQADQDLQIAANRFRIAAAESNPSVRNAFLDAAASSPAALERAIESYMARGSVEGEELSSGETLSLRHELEPRIREAFLSADQKLHELSEDQKSTALISLLKTILSEFPHPRICVTTRFASTAYYLSAAIEAEGLPVVIAVASAQRTNIREAVDSFVHSTGPTILVATRAAISLDSQIRRTTDLIFYEPLAPSAQVEKLIGQVNAIGRKEELRIYEMKPSQDAGHSK